MVTTFSLVYVNANSNATVQVTYEVHVCRYEMQDLHVTETLPQMVALSETYMQIYEQQQ